MLPKQAQLWLIVVVVVGERRHGLTESEYELGDPNERRYFLYVSGSWGRYKGIDTVLTLAELNPDDEFRVYGNSDVRPGHCKHPLAPTLVNPRCFFTLVYTHPSVAAGERVAGIRRRAPQLQVLHVPQQRYDSAQKTMGPAVAHSSV